MDALYWVLLAIAFVSAIVFIVFSNGQTTLKSLALKCFASFCFTLLAVGVCYLKGFGIAGMLFVMGFIASCFGDAILGLPDMPEMKEKYNNFVLVGGLSFAVAHIFYISAMIVLFGFAWWILLVAVALGLIFFFGNKFIGKLDYGTLNAGMPFYAIFVSLVVAQSIMAFVAGANTVGAVMLLIGFFLFWLSDIVLMNIYFGKKPEKNKFLYYFNLSFYYLAQILIAGSLMFLLP